MKTLTPAERQQLKGLAHGLEPVVLIGNAGLTPAVLKEIDVSLKAHELIKVKAGGAEREERVAWLEQICSALEAQPVQHIGKILVIYREKPEAPEQAPERSAKTSTRRSTKGGATKRAATSGSTTRSTASGTTGFPRAGAGRSKPASRSSAGAGSRSPAARPKAGPARSPARAPSRAPARTPRGKSSDRD